MSPSDEDGVDKKEGGDGWRDTLYVWDGILWILDETDRDAVKLKWEGTMVLCEDCPDAKKVEAPKRGAFARDVTSKMGFSVQGTARPYGDETASTGDMRPQIASLTGGEGWDSPDDGKKHHDDVNDMWIANLRWTGSLSTPGDKLGAQPLVFARGKNSLGHFVSAGWMKPGNRITLARRYLHEDDARAKWDFDDLIKAVIDGIYDVKSGKVHVPPWQCDALHSEVQKLGKRKNFEGGGDDDSGNKDEKQATSGDKDEKEASSDNKDEKEASSDDKKEG